MSKRYDVISGRKFDAGGQEKTSWTRYGSAWAKDNGSISVKLDGHSLTGEYLLVEPKPREGQQQGGRSADDSARHSHSQGRDDDDDGLPF